MRSAPCATKCWRATSPALRRPSKRAGPAARCSRRRVIGLIERERLYTQFSQPLWFDVYNRRPIAPLVTREAMVDDGTMPIEGV